MKKFEFFDESCEDQDGWWDEVYASKCGNHHCYALESVLDHCVSLEDKITLSEMPEYSDWPQ